MPPPIRRKRRDGEGLLCMQGEVAYGCNPYWARIFAGESRVEIGEPLNMGGADWSQHRPWQPRGLS